MKSTSFYWFVIGAFNGGCAMGVLMSFLISKPSLAWMWFGTMVLYDLIMTGVIFCVFPKDKENI